tara:strand:+ start:1146 stop:1247 length:102 start_codon:yes stop_codon:yes gene_type:complete
MEMIKYPSQPHYENSGVFVVKDNSVRKIKNKEK